MCNSFLHSIISSSKVYLQLLQRFPHCLPVLPALLTPISSLNTLPYQQLLQEHGQTYPLPKPLHAHRPHHLRHPPLQRRHPPRRLPPRRPLPSRLLPHRPLLSRHHPRQWHYIHLRILFRRTPSLPRSHRLQYTKNMVPTSRLAANR